jgi:hypothetical protein
MGQQTYITISGVIMASSRDAILFGIEDRDADTWIPKSVIEDFEFLNLDGADEVEINVAKWFLEKIGIDY